MACARRDAPACVAGVCDGHVHRVDACTTAALGVKGAVCEHSAAELLNDV